MTDYIDRDKLLRDIDHYHVSDGAFQHWVEIQDVEDVVPVVHGEWILRHVGVGHYWECSVCHTNPCIYVTKSTRFCPNCGAKMDGGNHCKVH